MLVPSRIARVMPASTESVVSGSSQWPSGPVGCLPPACAADLGSAVLLEALAEHDVVGHDEPVDAGLVGDAAGSNRGCQVPGSSRGERRDPDGELRYMDAEPTLPPANARPGDVMQRFWSYIAVQLGKHAGWVDGHRAAGHHRARPRHHAARVRHRPGQLPQHERPGLQGQRRLPGPVRRAGDVHRDPDGRGPHRRRAVHRPTAPQFKRLRTTRSTRSGNVESASSRPLTILAVLRLAGAEPRRQPDRAASPARRCSPRRRRSAPGLAGAAARAEDSVEDARSGSARSRRRSAPSTTPSG